MMMKCKCGGKLLMVKKTSLEEVYEFKNGSFYKIDADAIEEIKFRCEECSKSYNVDLNKDFYIASETVEKLVVKDVWDSSNSVGVEISLNKVKLIEE